MKDIILVDANSVGYAAHQSTVLKSGDTQTQATFGVIKAARAFRTRFPHGTILWLWDGQSWRKDHSESYKANRDDSPEKKADREAYKAQASVIRKALRHLGQKQVSASNYEADDLAARLSKLYVARGDFVKMISGDRDWLQLVGPNCIWEDHRDETRRVTHKTFQSHTGYDTASKFVQSKALQGDTSDNLAGVGKIGEKGAKELLDIYGSVPWFLADENRAETYRTARGKNLPKAFADFAAMEDRQQRFYHNMLMMDLKHPSIPKPVDLKVDNGEFDDTAFKDICHECGFASIYREAAFDHFIQPFIERK